MRKIVSKPLPGARATISFTDVYPAMSPEKRDRELLARFSAVNEELGYGKVEALDPMKRGAADTSFVAPYTATMDGLGLLGFREHSPEEHIDLRVVPKITKRTAVFLYRLIEGR